MRSFLYSFLILTAGLPLLVYGQGQIYSPLINFQNGGNQVNGFSDYMSFLYGMSISIAALLAVVKIIIAGAKYMLSDVVSSKGDALSDIRGAILGLLLILGAVIILEFINPDLISRNITFEAIGPRPTVNQSPSVSAAIASNAASMLQGCGTRSDSGSTATEFIITFNGTGCTDPGASAGQFGRDCIANGGRITASDTVALTSTCTIPKTGVGAGGRTPAAQEFPIGRGYSMTFFINPLVSGDLDLSETYFNNQAAVGNMVVYDAMRHCSWLLDASAQAEYGQSCLDSVKELLFETCSYTPGFACNTGWCIHNAGVKSGEFGCQLPYQRFSASAVKNKYQEVTPAAQQQSSFYGKAQFTNGCRALGGVVADIKLYGEEMDNLRCVKR